MSEGVQDEPIGGLDAAAGGTPLDPLASGASTGAPSPLPDAVDVGRRRFFRQLAADVFQATATVVGAANALQQTSIQAASAILDPDAAALAAAIAASTDGAADPATGAAPRGFRTPFRLENEKLILVDQRQLPGRLAEIECRSGADVAWAVREMVIRGAPAIGQAAAYGVALTASRAAELMPFARRATIRAAATALRSARPTAVNLTWAVDRMLARYEAVGSLEDDGSIIATALWDEADTICAEATRDHTQLAQHGLARLPATPDRPLRILTHCNTGPLACGQVGTALGVVQAAIYVGRNVHVHVDETRPYLQGARLTAWELEQAGVPYTLIADGAAGSLLASGAIDAILVGADRIAANGDTANKVGTYPLAALAARHRVPFFVCAPLSSVDLESPDGSVIPIEQRAASELLEIGGVRIAPPGAAVWNPAFDVTPAGLISAIVTEEGALVAPFGPALADAVAAKRARSGAVEAEPAAQVAAG